MIMLSSLEFAKQTYYVSFIPEFAEQTYVFIVTKKTNPYNDAASSSDYLLFIELARWVRN
ncbi:hypothetical protein BK127_33840 [Paenibacillus sp. FSL H7-0331]|nr:hypothetical protein BK127_33840 [Paenibacillus sp. FSL H7-0331]